MDSSSSLLTKYLLEFCVCSFYSLEELLLVSSSLLLLVVSCVTLKDKLGNPVSLGIQASFGDYRVS